MGHKSPPGDGGARCVMFGTAISIVPLRACSGGITPSGVAAAAGVFLAQTAGPREFSRFCAMLGRGEDLEK